jgi:hypothetical protein
MVVRARSIAALSRSATTLTAALSFVYTSHRVNLTLLSTCCGRRRRPPSTKRKTIDCRLEAKNVGGEEIDSGVVLDCNTEHLSDYTRGAQSGCSLQRHTRVNIVVNIILQD